MNLQFTSRTNSLGVVFAQTGRLFLSCGRDKHERSQIFGRRHFDDTPCTLTRTERKRVWFAAESSGAANSQRFSELRRCAEKMSLKRHSRTRSWKIVVFVPPSFLGIRMGLKEELRVLF